MSEIPRRHARAVLSEDGRYVAADPLLAEILGADPQRLCGAVSFARIPVTRRDHVLWVQDSPRTSPHALVCRLAPLGARQWSLEVTEGEDRSALRLRVQAFVADVLDEVIALERDQVVTAISRHLARACGVSAGHIVLMDSSSRLPVFASGAGADSSGLAAMRDAWDKGAPMAIAEAFEDSRIVLREDWAELIREDDRMRALREMLPAAGRLASVYIALPLGLNGTTEGVFAGLVRGADIDPAAVQNWSAHAWGAAVALRAAEVAWHAERTAGARERRRLSAEVHDTVSQSLFAAKMLAATIAVEGASDPRVAEIARLVTEADRGIRDVLAERITDGAGALSARIESSVQAMPVMTRSLRLDPVVDRLDSACGETVLRVVQEALRNVVKHAHASELTVTVSYEPDASLALLIEIRDDGVGFAHVEVGTGRFGLEGIRERLRSYDGTLDVVSDGGTVLRARMRPVLRSAWDAAPRVDPPSSTSSVSH